MLNSSDLTLASALLRNLRPQLKRKATACFGCVIWLTTCFAFPVPAMAQTLAHPGWVGSGMNIERWWRHTVIFDISVGGQNDGPADPDHGLQYATAHMDDLQALGVDALIIRNPPAVPPASAGSQGPGIGGPPEDQLQAFDDLVQQASRRRLRVLVALGPMTSDDLTGTARFWLSRGIAGFYLSTSPAPGSSTGATSQSALGQGQETLALRNILKGFAGERIIISEMPADMPFSAAPAAGNSVTQGRGRRARGSSAVTGSGSSRAGSTDPEMVLVRVVDPSAGIAAEAVRISLESAIQRVHTTSSTPLLALTEDAGVPRLSTTGDAVLGKVEAALLLGVGAPVLIEGRGLRLPNAESLPQEAGDVASSGGTPQPVNRYVAAARAAKEAKEATAREAAAVVERHSLFEWYKQLNALAHGDPTMRYGGYIVLNRDSDRALVWLRTPKASGPVVVIACNLASQPATFSLVEDIARLHLRGSFLRTLLRSDDGMGAMPLRAVTLPPYGVYIGELSR